MAWPTCWKPGRLTISFTSTRASRTGGGLVGKHLPEILKVPGQQLLARIMQEI